MVVPQDRTSSYRFGIFELVLDPLELRKNGRRIKVRPQSLKLLRLLLDGRATTVPRDAIQAAMWGADVFVDVEQGVNHCIKELRAALRDDAESPRFIQTIPRQGYRFIAPVEAIAASPLPIAAPDTSAPVGAPAPTASRAAWGWGLVTAALVLTALVVMVLRQSATAPASLERATVAVLPFAVDSESPPYLGVSIADAMIAGLARQGAITVRPLAAVMRYESSPAPAVEVAQALAVDMVVTGTIAREGARSRIRFAVTRASDGSPVVTDAISGPTDSFEGLEAALVDRVARALRVPLSRSANPAARVRDPNAHRAYLEGRYRLARLTADDTQAAIAAFERALALDATDAPAHAGLAIASAQMYIRFGSQADVGLWKTRAERHAAEALAIDPQRAEAHEALAAVARYTEFDWDRVVEQSYAAVQLNPGLDLPHYYVAAALQHVGRFELVEDEIVAGLEANPWNLSEAYRLRGVTALWSGRFSDARTELERVRQLAARPVSDPHLAAALYYGGDAAAAEAMLDGLTGSAQAEQRATALLASIVAARGDRPRARALAARVESRAYHDHHVDYSLGATYAGLGDVAAAIRWLRQASSGGFLAYPWYQQDPLLKPLQGLPEFEAVLVEARAASDRVVAKVIAGRQRSRTAVAR